MSAVGVSLFYGSEDAQTAIAEIAGHGVAPIAVIGEFRTARALHILDLTATPAMPGSIFDPDMRHEIAMQRFVGTFVEKVTIPVIPDGREHLEYAPTQVLTDYIRWMSTSLVDGIALPSATNPGKKTYVLFSGPDEVGDEAKKSEHHVLTLAPEDVAYYDVRRSYEGIARRRSASGS